jgi:hypothetical protein
MRDRDGFLAGVPLFIRAMLAGASSPLTVLASDRKYITDLFPSCVLVAVQGSPLDQVLGFRKGCDEAGTFQGGSPNGGFGCGHSPEGCLDSSGTSCCSLLVAMRR